MMRITISLFATLLFTLQVVAQDGGLHYRRSSLYTIMIDDSSYENKKLINKTFQGMPIPEKFNDHNLSVRFFTPKSSSRSDKNFGTLYARKASNLTGGIVESPDKERLDKIFEDNFDKRKVARDLIAKWYNQQPDGSFNMDLIAGRGMYNATELEAGIASKSVRGLSLLKDAGQELIQNTFIVVVRFNYVNKEDLGNKVNEVGGVIGSRFGALGITASSLASVATSTLARGYVVRASACLYQLEWNEEIQTLFESKYWSAPELFKSAEEFSIKFVGRESAWADVQSTSFSRKTQDELIERATVRSVDAVISKLQRNYEAFRVKTPLFTVEPQITAKIGLKEGLEGNDKYEVLEQVINPETNETTYKRRVVIKVKKSNIWDNRYNAGEEQEENREAEEVLEYTIFKGKAKGLYPGMLIRQID